MTYVLDSDSIRLWDQYTIHNEPISSLDLMERAANKCANWIASKWSNEVAFSILCGNGNNGGDGLAIARLLLENGYKVWVYISLNAKRSADNEKNLHELNYLLPSCILPIEKAHEIPSTHIVIDAIFGTGINSEINEDAKNWISTLNKLSNIKVSIDLPSGLHADDISNTDHVVKSDYTLTFQCFKRSFLFPESGKYCGEITLLDIGLHPSFTTEGRFRYEIIDADSIRKVHKKREPFSHKGNFGHSLIIAGSHGKMGACILAAKACLRSGTGLLTVAIPDSENSIAQTSIPEAMTIPYTNADELTNLEKYTSMGIGCGLGTDDVAYQIINNLLNESSIPLVLDADALNIISSENDLKSLIPEGSLITPHPKEFDRLFGESKNSQERFEKQQEQAQKLGIYILLKGRFTSIATPEGKVFININGNPGMATGGSGDVLTGIITALFAQYHHMELAAKIGCFLHGMAGDLAQKNKGDESLIASDIINQLPEAFKHLFYSDLK